MDDFLNMGDYGHYVWPAYGLVTLVLVALLVASRNSLRKSEALLRTLQDSDPGRRRARKKTRNTDETAEEANNEA